MTEFEIRERKESNNNTIFHKVKALLKDISPCHGFDHAIAVFLHAVRAIQEYKELDNRTKEIIAYSALLHDVDDPKFFKDSDNAGSILKKFNFTEEEIKLAKYIISLVSSSKNGDSIPAEAKDKSWLLIPRWCDRLEAIGKIGIERCATFRKNVTKAPFFVESTPRPKDMKELWTYATEERYKNYKGKSLSMIDHYFDKLLRLGSFECDNAYVAKEAEKRKDIMAGFVLWAVKNEKELSDDMIDKYLA